MFQLEKSVGPQLIGWQTPKIGSLLSLPIQMLSLLKKKIKTLRDTPRIMFNQISGHPMT